MVMLTDNSSVILFRKTRHSVCPARGHDLVVNSRWSLAGCRPTGLTGLSLSGLRWFS